MFVALESLNLLSKSPSNTTFPQIRKPLRLLVDEVDDVNPNDISYVYSGYAPLSVRLVQCVSMKPAVLATSVTAHNNSNNNNHTIQTPAADRDDAAESVAPDTLPRAHAIVGWKGFEETVRAIPGATFDEVQKAEHGGASANRTSLFLHLL